MHTLTTLDNSAKGQLVNELRQGLTDAEQRTAWWGVLTRLLQQHGKGPELQDDFSSAFEYLSYAKPQKADEWQVTLTDEHLTMLMRLCQCMGALGTTLVAHGKGA